MSEPDYDPMSYGTVRLSSDGEPAASKGGGDPEDMLFAAPNGGGPSESRAPAMPVEDGEPEDVLFAGGDAAPQAAAADDDDWAMAEDVGHPLAGGPGMPGSGAPEPDAPDSSGGMGGGMTGGGFGDEDEGGGFGMGARQDFQMSATDEAEADMHPGAGSGLDEGRGGSMAAGPDSGDPMDTILEEQQAASTPPAPAAPPGFGPTGRWEGPARLAVPAAKMERPAAERPQNRSMRPMANASASQARLGQQSRVDLIAAAARRKTRARALAMAILGLGLGGAAWLHFDFGHTLMAGIAGAVGLVGGLFFYTWLKD